MMRSGCLELSPRLAIRSRLKLIKRRSQPAIEGAVIFSTCLDLGAVECRVLVLLLSNRFLSWELLDRPLLVLQFQLGHHMTLVFSVARLAILGELFHCCDGLRNDYCSESCHLPVFCVP